MTRRKQSTKDCPSCKFFNIDENNMNIYCSWGKSKIKKILSDKSNMKGCKLKR